MIRVSFRNLVSNITASSQDKDYPAENLLDARPSSKWASGAAFLTTHTLSGTFSGITKITCLALLNLECNVYATITIRLKRGAITVKTFTLSGEEILYGYGEGPYGLFAYGGYAAPGREWMARFRTRWFEDVYCDSWQVVIDQTDNNPCSLGTVFFGTHWEAPTRINQNYETGFKQQIGDIQRNIAAISVSPINIVGRTVGCELHMLTEDDVVTWNDNIDLSIPILFTIRPEQEDTEALFGTIYGYLQNEVSFTGSKAKRFRGKVTIDEVK